MISLGFMTKTRKLKGVTAALSTLLVGMFLALFKRDCHFAFRPPWRYKIRCNISEQIQRLAGICEGWSLEISIAYRGAVVRRDRISKQPTWLVSVSSTYLSENPDRAWR
jgi:hypothetical protein